MRSKLISIIFLFVVFSSSVLAATDCFKKGEWFDRSVNEESICCEGLKETSAILIVGDSCEVMNEQIFTCLNCGDGICEKGQVMGGESFCTCPEDCKPEANIKPDIKRTYLEEAGAAKKEAKLETVSTEQGIIEEKRSFFSTLTFKILVLVVLLSTAGIIILFVYKKRSTAPEK